VGRRTVLNAPAGNRTQ